MFNEIASMSGPTTPTKGSASTSNINESTSTSHPRISSLRDETSTDSTPHRPHSISTSQYKRTMDPQIKTDMKGRTMRISLERYITDILEVDEEEFERRKRKNWESVKSDLKEEIKIYTSVDREAKMYDPFAAMATKIISKSSEVMGETMKYPFDLQYRNQSRKAPESDKTFNSDSEVQRVRMPDVVSVPVDVLGETDEGLPVQAEVTLAAGQAATEGQQSYQEQPNASVNNATASARPPPREDNLEDEGYASDTEFKPNSSWEKIFLSLEFKRTPPKKITRSKRTPASGSRGASRESTPALRGSQNRRGSNQSQQFAGDRKQASYSQSDRAAGKRKATSQSGQSGSNSKRPKVTNASAEKVEGKGITLTAEEQLATYAMEQLSNSGLRSHTLGMVIKDNDINLCYYDREGCIRADSFDFIQEFDTFCAILISIHMLDAHQWGFSPYLEIIPGVIPHCDKDESAVTMTIDDLRVRLTAVKYQQYCLLGRGTSVYDAIVIKGPDDKIGKEVVVKCSWQVKKRLREDETIKRARERLLSRKEYAKYAENVPEVYAASEKHGLKMVDIRKRFTSNPEFIFEERVVRAIVFPQYEPIWSIASLDLFCEAFRVIFECHRALTICGILHRDISISNLMFRMVDGRIVGILLDFDLATITDGEGRPPDQTSRFRTGTPKFMEISLLEGAPGPHLYRYDLESFFYVLVWIGCNFDGGKKVASGSPNWHASSNSKMVEVKKEFLMHFGMFNLTPTYMPLYRTWIENLFYLLYGGYAKLWDWERNKALKGTHNRLDAKERIKDDEHEFEVAAETKSVIEDLKEQAKRGAVELETTAFATLFNLVTYERFKDVIDGYRSKKV